MGPIAHVGIVGAGLAGLAAALAAARAGVHVQVFEAEPAALEPAVHLDIVPNLLRDLARLGVGTTCARIGFPYRCFSIVNADGQAQFDVPTPALAGPALPAALGMVYGDLLRILREAARERGVAIRMGQRVVDAFADGPEGPAIVTSDGTRHPVDLSVLASGCEPPNVAGSAARPLMLESLPQVWCHALLPRPRSLDRAAWVTGSTVLKAIVVPVDVRRAGIAVLQAASPAPDVASVRQALNAEGSLLRSLAGHWTDETVLTSRWVRSGVLHGPWHEHGVLRIGHSAHVLPPHLGQAAAQSVEDALVLGDLLRAGMTRTALLDAFMARRGERARRVHALTTQAARWQLRPDAATDLPALAEELAALTAEPA